MKGQEILEEIYRQRLFLESRLFKPRAIILGINTYLELIHIYCDVMVYFQDGKTANGEVVCYQGLELIVDHNVGHHVSVVADLKDQTVTSHRLAELRKQAKHETESVRAELRKQVKHETESVGQVVYNDEVG